MGKLKYTVEEYNKIAKDHHDLAQKLRRNLIKLICSKCNSEVQEQDHIDDTTHPFQRQVICVNDDCGEIFYRIE